jgi:hypothetical protein
VTGPNSKRSATNRATLSADGVAYAQGKENIGEHPRRKSYRPPGSTGKPTNGSQS